MEALSLDEDACKKTLMSLSTPKIRILIRASQLAANDEVSAQESDGDSRMIDTGQAAQSQEPEGSHNI